MAYDAQAQDFAYGFYARGLSKEKALREIRKLYPGFAGSTWDDWVEKLGWRERRSQADVRAREFEGLVRDTVKVLLLELDGVRKTLFQKLGDGADTQAVYAYTSVCKQIADLSHRHLSTRGAGRLALEVLNAAFEKLFTLLREDAELAKLLELKAALVGKSVEKVAEEFGADA
jgi:hypothetical protein